MAASASALASRNATRSRTSLGCAIPLGLVFAVPGLIAFWFVTLRPALLTVSSADWIETPCEIVSSKLERHSGSKGSTHRVAIRYRYSWPPAEPAVEAETPAPAERSRARVFESDRYDFSKGSTNIGMERMRAAVREHPPGRRTTCLVDPADPESAVLDRRLPITVWFGLLALLFPAVGIGLVVHAWRSRRHAGTEARSPFTTSADRGSRSTVDAAAAPAQGEIPLTRASRLGGVAAPLAFAVIWNGMLVLVGGEVLSDFKGLFSWMLLLFFVPFALVGLVMATVALQGLARLFAPRVEVRLDPSRLRLGERIPLSWRIGGRGVRKFTLSLVGREETSYRQGKNRRTERSEFHRSVVFESTDLLALAEGRAELALPRENAAACVSGESGRIVWELVCEGEIPWRGDLDDRFILDVREPSEPPRSNAPAAEPREFANGHAALWTLDRLAPGEPFVFTVQARGAGASGPLVARLGWVLRGKDSEEGRLVWTQPVPSLTPGADLVCETTLPLAPWSVSGSLVSIEWRLELVDSRERVLVSAPLVVAPGGEAVRLRATVARPSAFEKRKVTFRATGRS